MSDERHKAAMVLQTALQNIIPLNEQKLKHTASMLARQYWEKVRLLGPVIQLLGDDTSKESPHNTILAVDIPVSIALI